MARTPPSLDRRKPMREPKRWFIIFCEGKNTEPTYFEALQRSMKGALIKIEAVGVGGVPSTVAEKAIARASSLGVGKKRKKGRNSFEDRDEVWAVFDCDSHESYYRAIERCRSACVGVGRSNPCFELWLILHKENYDRPDGRKAMQKHLRSICPEYDPKGRKMADCMALIGSIERAENRAEKQFQRRGREKSSKHRARPYTTVWKLTRAIRTAAKMYRPPE